MRNLKLQQFASDNYSGICPEAFESLEKANCGHELSYGEDHWTEEACNLFRKLFETDCEVFFVFNGTAANSLALASLCQSYHSIICYEYAHIETDECGAPEFYSNGAKLLSGTGENGKIHPDSIEKIVTKRSDIHYPKPKAISITQATELGTVYTTEDLHKIKKVAEKYNLKIHMDGARFSNAVASLDVEPKDISWKCGVDVLCFGGTKNGLPLGEAIIFFNKALSEDFEYRCKQAGQLASKMRFLAAPWIGILKNNIWLKNARHSNHCAEILEEQLRAIDEIEIMFPRQVNSVFAKMPENVVQYLYNQGWHFYSFIGVGGSRLMCSWDTTEETIQEFVKDIKDAIYQKS